MVNIKVGNFRIGNRILSNPMNIEIPSGHIHALTGPNGCGKSLLLDSLTGVFPSNEVHVQIDGSPVKSKHAYARWQAGIRRMFQTPTLPGDISVQSILDRFIVVPHKRKEWVNQANNLLLDAGIQHYKLFGSHSFGQKRIIELIVALSSGKFCVLDEPFSGISPELSSKMKALFELVLEVGSEDQASVLVIDHLTSFHSDIYSQIHIWKAPSISNADFVGIDNFSEKYLQVKPLHTNWLVEELKIDNRLVINNLELSLPPGSVIMIMGGNGSGKSTLLRGIGGFSHPWKGVRQTIRRGTPSKNIVFSPQPPKLVHEISALENLKLMISRGGKLQRNAMIVATELTKWLGVPPSRLRQKAEVLSGGESSMIALVGSVLSSAPIMLLDEPFESLSQDAIARASILLYHALDKGKSAIISLHNANEYLSESTLQSSLVLDPSMPLSGFLEGTR